MATMQSCRYDATLCWFTENVVFTNLGCPNGMVVVVCGGNRNKIEWYAQARLLNYDLES